MCEGGEERWRDVRQRGRRKDRSGARERNKRLLTPLSISVVTPRSHNRDGCLDSCNAQTQNLACFAPIHPDQENTADLGPPYLHKACTKGLDLGRVDKCSIQNSKRNQCQNWHMLGPGCLNMTEE